MKIVMYLLALIAGSALSLEGAIYVELEKNIGQLEAPYSPLQSGN